MITSVFFEYFTVYVRNNYHSPIYIRKVHLKSVPKYVISF